MIDYDGDTPWNLGHHVTANIALFINISGTLLMRSLSTMMQNLRHTPPERVFMAYSVGVAPYIS